MNVTIQTLTVQVENKSVPLTKAMVNQLQYLYSSFPKGWDIDNVKCIGSVSLTDALWYLYETPEGLHRSRSFFSRLSEQCVEPPRLVLLK
jgi:hypothetical protein